MQSGRRQVHLLAAIASAAMGAAPAEPAAAARHPLQKVVEKIEASGPGYVIETDPRSGDAIIRYDDGQGRWLRAVYVPPNKLAVTIAAAVSDAPDGAVRYDYRLVSSRSSQQRAAMFILEFAGAVVDVTTPASWKAAAMQPISALSWDDSMTGTQRLAPGKSMGGFGFKATPGPSTRRLAASASVGAFGFARSPATLPGIVRCYVRGDAPPITFPTEPGDDYSKSIPQTLDAGLAGSTVGPVAIPDSDTLRQVLASMERYARQSLELGWIERQETAARYADMLAAIRQLVPEPPPAATAQGPAASAPGPAAVKAVSAHLRALTAQVEKDSKTEAITSEAYGLLVFNARYVLARLDASR